MDRFRDIVVTANFLRLTPGTETTATEQIRGISDECCLFKFLGSYDLLRLEVTDKLTTHHTESPIEDILEISSVSATPLPSDTEDPDSQFIDNLKSICSYPILAIIFIQLRTDQGYASRHNKQQELVNQSRITLEKEDIDFCLEGLLSYGKDDLCMLFGTKTFKSVFELIEIIRTDYGGTLIDSTTYITIEFGLIEDRDRLLELNEKVSVEILASCEPGAEQGIISAFNGTKFSFNDVLGKEDIRIISKGKISAGEAIAAVLDCRNNEDIADNALISTTTYIECELDQKSLEITYEGKFELTSRREKFREVSGRCLLLLDDLTNHERVDQYFVQKCKEALTKLKSSALIESSYHLTSDLDICIEYQLIEIIKALKEEVDSGEGILTTEKAFQFLTSNIVNAVAQRTLNLHDYRHGLPDLPNKFGQGAFLISEAIAKLVRQLYEIMEHERVGTNEWEGFILFSQLHGFKCFTSSVFSLPSNSLSSILDPALNWLTLSHEICHDIWADLDVFKTPRAWVVGGQNASFKDILDGAASDAGIAPPDSKFSMAAEPMLGEWYAHWFDYKHFYSSDFNFFSWSIWSSWLRLPLVQNNITEYFHRSLAVFVSHNIGRYTERHLSKDETIKLTESLFDDLLALLGNINLNGFERKHEEMILEEREEISSWVGSNIGFIHQFEQSCTRSDFSSRMERDVESALSLVPQLAEGCPVKEHDNVFSLLIASMKWIYMNKFDRSYKFDFAFLMSCIFATTEYENRNTD